MMIGHGSRAEMEKDPMNWGAARRGALRFVVNNILREKLMELTGGPLFEDVVPYMVDPSETGGSYTAGGLIYGEGNATIGGQVAGLIGDVPTCKDLIAKMMSQAEAIIDQLKAKASA
jgi:NAD(P)H-dependent flavin oxidoreductase YrpB (nitropropane dioxygenase family)